MSRLRIAFTLFGLLSMLLACLPAVAQQAGCVPGHAGDTAQAANWHYLVDQSGRLTLTDILDQRPLFLRLEQPRYVAPGDGEAVWLHTQLLDCGRPHWLRIVAPHAERLDFYSFTEQELQRLTAEGVSNPPREVPLAARAYLFAVPDRGEPQELFIRLQAPYLMAASFVLVDESGLLALNNATYLQGALLGAFVLLVLYSVWQLPRTGRHPHLWLCMLAVTLLGDAAVNMGLMAIWLPTLELQQGLIADLLSLLVGLLALVLTLAFFDYRRKTLLDWLPWASVLLLGALALVLLTTPFAHHSPLLHGLALTGLLSALMSSVALRQGQRSEHLLSAALLLLSLCSALRLATLTAFLPGDADPANDLVLWGNALGGLLLTVALHERRRFLDAASQHAHAAEALSSAELKARSDFLAYLSHEIRAPLNGVLGMAELLQSTSLSAKQRDYVQTIHSSGNELLALLNEVLDSPLHEAGQIELDDMQFDLHALLDDCLDSLRSRAEQQGVELITMVQPEVPRIVSGDPARLRQVLLGLLENALRQTAQGEILLLAAIDTTSGAPRLRLTVQDDGEPLPSATRDAILRPSPDTRPTLGASGAPAYAGLLVARQLIRLMKGNLNIKSGPTGNMLWVTLPLSGVTQAEESSDLDTVLVGARLLIVDDNETCLKVLQQQCANWGMQVSIAGSGREALAILRTRAHLRDCFDVVLLDQDMPGMTGLQLAIRIKEDMNLQHDVLLIMLTGVSRAPSKIEARNAGIRRILAKPVAGYTLRTTLADELSKRTSPPKMVAGPAAGEAPGMPQDFRILVAEDDRTSTKVMAGMLKKLDLVPEFVSNGEEALQALQQRPYDLVLMDCEMPLMDGFSVTRRLREWEAQTGRSRTPVVALTAHVFSEHKERAQAAGMDGHMAKPVELSQLRDLVRHWIDAKAAAEP